MYTCLKAMQSQCRNICSFQKSHFKSKDRNSEYTAHHYQDTTEYTAHYYQDTTEYTAHYYQDTTEYTAHYYQDTTVFARIRISL
jgi:hypothetical protein